MGIHGLKDPTDKENAARAVPRILENPDSDKFHEEAIKMYKPGEHQTIIWCEACQVQHQIGIHTKPNIEEVKSKYDYTRQQLEDAERIAEARGFTIAVKAISIVAAQLLGPQHKVMILINTLKGN